MKCILTLALLLGTLSLFSQWQRVTQLPATHIFTIYQQGHVLYAGGTHVIYTSKNDGASWDSTAQLPTVLPVNNIILYKNTLYAAGPSAGVFKSADGGAHWQNISKGLLFPDVADFCIFDGELYAATFGNAVYKLDTATYDRWTSFSNGLSDLSANMNALGANSHALVGGTNGNGLYGRLPAGGTTWSELFLLNRINPNEGTYDILNAHDTLFLMGRTGTFYLSVDNGEQWTLFGRRIASAFTSGVNARESLVFSRYFFDGIASTTDFFYAKKDALQNDFVTFSTVHNHFTYRLLIAGNQLWDASDHGLFFMPLSALPGISAADDTTAVGSSVSFTSFNADCSTGVPLLKWQVDHEEQLTTFTVEQSADGRQWTIIDQQNSPVHSSNGKHFLYKVIAPLPNAFYRVLCTDKEGAIQISASIRAGCGVQPSVRLWPNPVHDRGWLQIFSPAATTASVRIINSRGAIVSMQVQTFVAGDNQVFINSNRLPAGAYQILLRFSNGYAARTITFLKQ